MGLLFFDHGTGGPEARAPRAPRRRRCGRRGWEENGCGGTRRGGRSPHRPKKCQNRGGLRINEGFSGGHPLGHVERVCGKVLHAVVAQSASEKLCYSAILELLISSSSSVYPASAECTTASEGEWTRLPFREGMGFACSRSASTGLSVKLCRTPLTVGKGLPALCQDVTIHPCLECRQARPAGTPLAKHKLDSSGLARMPGFANDGMVQRGGAMSNRQHDLAALGLNPQGTVHWNLSVPDLVESAIRRGEGRTGGGGALQCDHRPPHRTFPQGSLRGPRAEQRGRYLVGSRQCRGQRGHL